MIIHIINIYQLSIFSRPSALKQTLPTGSTPAPVKHRATLQELSSRISKHRGVFDANDFGHILVRGESADFPSLQYQQSPYPLVNVYITDGKITMFNG